MKRKAVSLDDVVNLGDVKLVLTHLKTRKEEVSWQMAAKCLSIFLKTATVEEYKKLLSLLPAGEYPGQCELYPRWDVEEKWLVNKLMVKVHGTLVSLAAALDRADILECLLRRGHDVNAAAFSSIAALVSHPFAFFSESRQERPCEFCTVTILDDLRYVGFGGHPIVSRRREAITPLALAVLMGHADCVRVLLEHGAWMEQEPSVSWAMHLAWRENDENYRAAREIVLRWGEPSDHRPVLSALSDCSLERFRSVLHTHSYTRKEFEDWVDSQNYWLSQVPPDRYDRLVEIGKVSPDTLASAKGMNLVFRWSRMEGFSLEKLLPAIEGRRVDLTNVGWFELPVSLIRKLLTELCKHCEPVADRWNLEEITWTVERVRLLLRHVKFYSGERKQRIGGLTKAIKSTGNANLIRSALEKGEIVESAKDLLCWMQTEWTSEVFRKAVLTTGRARFLCAEDWDGPEEWEEPTQQAYTTVQIDGKSFDCYSLRAACLCGDVEEVRRGFRKEKWDGLFRTYLQNQTSEIRIGTNGEHCFCSLLCAAALGGQNEVIRLLLEEFSVPVDEWRYGTYSIWNAGFVSCLVDAPTAAALGGHWDTVNLLLERGASAHWENVRIQGLWKRLRGTDLAEEVRAHLGGGHGAQDDMVSDQKEMCV